MADRFSFRLIWSLSLAVLLASGCAKLERKPQSLSRQIPRPEKPVNLSRSQQSALQTELARSVEENGDAEHAKSLYEKIIERRPEVRSRPSSFGGFA